MNISFSIDLYPVLLGALAAFVFGWFYYSPWCFGRYWAKVSGVSLTDKPKFLVLMLAYGASLITAVGIYLAFEMAHVATIQEAAQMSLLLAFFFIFPAQLGRQLWEPKPFVYFLGNLFYQLASFSVIGVCMVVVL